MRPIRRRPRRLLRLLNDRRAATAVEYGLIAALVVITMIVALKGVAATTVGMWSNIADTVERVRVG